MTNCDDVATSFWKIWAIVMLVAAVDEPKDELVVRVVEAGRPIKTFVPMA